MTKCECAKCGGKGEIKAFSGIAGGICFSCNGKGYVMLKQERAQSFKFGADFGEGVVCWKKAKNADAARKAFVVQFYTSPLAGKEFEVVGA